ncbi:MAG: outer membrane lipoprotein-sorting protein [Sphaerochaeta sp.]|jgi:outer membrane lipoprotein-sorting protein|nr:outer membrane lipoprotein-sorting protein [Sphaerochaeta sp.]MDX9914487.1 outer membrane lipoprotein-sorting protein [Sphaerochaeta sp.]
MSRKTLFIITLLLFFSCASLWAITAEEIIAAVDANTSFASSHSSGAIITVDRFGEKKSTFEAWSKGDNTSLIEFTSLAERGQKILRTGSSLYLYYPEADQLIRLQGAALRQSVLGSDLSYEDMTRESSTLASYDATLEGEDVIDGIQCWIVKLVAKSRSSAYPIQTLWVDQERFVVRKGLYATAAGRALKEMEVIALMEVGGVAMAKESRIADLLKRGSSTTMRIESIEIDIPLPDALFSLENLSW